MVVSEEFLVEWFQVLRSLGLVSMTPPKFGMCCMGATMRDTEKYFLYSLLVRVRNFQSAWCCIALLMLPTMMYSAAHAGHPYRIPFPLPEQKFGSLPGIRRFRLNAIELLKGTAKLEEFARCWTIQLNKYFCRVRYADSIHI